MKISPIMFNISAQIFSDVSGREECLEEAKKKWGTCIEKVEEERKNSIMACIDKYPNDIKAQRECIESVHKVSDEYHRQCTEEFEAETNWCDKRYPR
jgi:hypothetical protein